MKRKSTPRYASPGAFREAISARLRIRAQDAGIPVIVLRKQAALERLIARLTAVAPNSWALKGGFALDTRLGARARASMDLDTDHRQGPEAAREDLERAMAEDLDDNFAFAIAGQREIQEGGVKFADRYRIDCAVAGTLFETFEVDVTLVPPERWEVEEATRPGLLAEVGLGPVNVLLVPLERQVAEKLHAYTRSYGGRPSTRVRDLVDFVLIRQFEQLDGDRLRSAITETFRTRATHAVPSRLPPPPGDWPVPYREEALAVGIPPDTETAFRLTSTWLDPILDGRAHGVWDPVRSTWGEA